MTVKKTAALFPGQGAYFSGALAEVKDVPEIRELLREIDEVAGRFATGPVSELLFAAEGPALDDLLRSDPDRLQLAIYAGSVATHRFLLSRGVRPDVLVGHSFGEIAALVCAGAFAPAAGAEIVCHRNTALRAMGEADGYLLAVSVDAPRAERMLELINDPQAVVAAENHDRQTILAGPRASMDTVGAVAAALGLATVPLRSPYPFHSPLLRNAAFDFAYRMLQIPQSPLEFEVYSPIAGRAYRDSDRLTIMLAGHLTQRVRFGAALRELREAGVTTFVECGPRDALTRIGREVLGSGPDFVPLLVPGSPLSQAVAGLTSAPGLSAGEFDGRSWQSCAERIVHFAVTEFAAVAGGSAGVETVGGTETFASIEEEFGQPRRVEAEPEPVAAPSVPEIRSRTELLRELVVIYADALEYPPEVFDEDTDLESELGVDSVKQTELLRRIGDAYRLGPLPADFKLGEHNTLGRIADLIAAA